MNEINSLHSRSIIAGYKPRILNDSRILVVGLGALGQNLVQNLALLGIGRMILVDFDLFEQHNATRSPFYPTAAEADRFDRSKAAVAAHRAQRISTASAREIYYANESIQALGDGAIAWADVVVSAVDSLRARAWLAERCRILGKPMLEGGIAGFDFNLSAFAATPGTPCYRCGRPERETSMSCTAYALEAAAAEIIPAIQTSAAVLAGYLAEQVVQLLHGDVSRLGYRSYGNVRKGTLYKASLEINPKCPGYHEPQPVVGTLQAPLENATVAQLAAEINEFFGGAQITFSETIIPALNCTRCRALCQVRALESSWLSDPLCTDCGGPWSHTKSFAPDSVSAIDTRYNLSEDIGATYLRDLGLRPGSFLLASLVDGQSGLLRMAGDILARVHAAS
jgi:molybdopterin/thiamine biosynthesis adenylyltransferase